MSETEDQQSFQDRFVPWSDGAAMLGLSRQSFFYLVTSGKIRKKKGKNSRDGRYSLVDILHVKEMRESGTPRKPRPKRLTPVVYDWLVARDIPACLRLDQLIYDKMLLAQAAQYEQWVTHNPHIAMAAFDAKDRNTCLAYVSILPLPEKSILDILTGKRDELSIQAHEIETYDRPGGYTLLVNSAARHPERPDLLFGTIHRIMNTWLEWYPERYIKRVYAQAYSNEGDRLIQYFFMSPLYHLASNAYMLDMARPGMSRSIRNFQRALSEKAPYPAEIQPTYTPPLPSSGRLSAIVTQAKAERTTTSTLPPGYVAFPEMAERHNVNVNSLRSDLREEKVMAERGHWLYRGKALSLAFSPEQHRAFSQFYRHRSSFQWCPDCLDEHGTL